MARAVPTPAYHLRRSLGFLSLAASELRVSHLAPAEHERLLSLAEALRVVLEQAERVELCPHCQGPNDHGRDCVDAQVGKRRSL